MAEQNSKYLLDITRREVHFDLNKDMVDSMKYALYEMDKYNYKRDILGKPISELEAKNKQIKDLKEENERLKNVIYTLTKTISEQEEKLKRLGRIEVKQKIKNNRFEILEIEE